MVYLIAGIATFLILASAFSLYYHKKFNVKEGFVSFFMRFWFLDYMLFPVRWFPGIAGMALRYVVYKIWARRLGKNVTIMEGVNITHPRCVEIGDNTGIGSGSILESTGDIKIGSWVRIGPRATLLSTNHKIEQRGKLIKHQGYDVGSINIGDDVWLGANVTILQNVTIGQGAVIGAGSVVTKDIPEYAIAVGNPATVIRFRE